MSANNDILPHHTIAWILDAQPHREGILLWLKTLSGQTIRAIHKFKPTFYVTYSMDFINKCNPRDLSFQYQILASRLDGHLDIDSVSIVDRRIKAEDVEFSLCLEIKVTSPFRYKKVIQNIREIELLEFFNTDLPLVQTFFYQTGLFPFAKVAITFKKNPRRTLHEHEIKNIFLHDSVEEIHYEIPPLRIVWLDIITDSNGIINRNTDQLKSVIFTIDPDSSPIDVTNLIPLDMLSKNESGAIQITINEGSEYDTLQFLPVVLQRIDPDIIFTHKGDETIFPFLLARGNHLNLAHILKFGRDDASLNATRFKLDGTDNYFSYGQIYHRAQTQFYLNGRLHINSAIMGSLHFNDGNLHGIIEIARIGYIPLQRLTRITIGGALQSIQFYYAYHQGILIPEDKKNVEIFQAASNLLFSDRGGHILNPKVGTYDRVAELDFTSMYPSLMVFYNVSPETVNCPCCKETGYRVPGLPYHTCKNRKGVVPLALRLPLAKRIAYKQLSKTMQGPDAKRYDQIQTALKWILVVCFGYLGFRNARFGRIEAHQAVCAFAREFLLNAVNIVESHNITYIHGIVDSLYVQAPSEMPDDKFHAQCQQIVHEITHKTNIPIAYDPENDFFSFISFLPTKAVPEIGALNRYWGIKPSGKAKVRGLELRRHDAPVLIKKFQEELMRVINESPDRHDFEKLFQRVIVPTFRKYNLYLESGQASAEDLAVNIRLTRTPREYKVQNYQAIAALHLEKSGLVLGPGQKVSFIIVNDRAPNKMDRALPLQLFLRRRASYDVEKYKELLLRAFTNMLPFQLTEEQKSKLQNKNFFPLQKGDFQQILLSDYFPKTM